MKIALNIEWVGARRGGAEKYAGTLARALVEAGHEVHLLARGVDEGEVPPSVVIHELHMPGRSIFGLTRRPTYHFAAGSERVLNRESFDLVIGFNKTWRQDVYLAVAGAAPASNEYSFRRFRKPLERGLHRLGKLLSPRQWLYRQIERKQFVDHHAHVVAPSHFSARHFHEYHGLPPDQVTVVYNGLDVERAAIDRAAARTAFRTAHGISDEQVAVLFTARNYSLKGLEPLLESFALCGKSRSRAVLVVCGSSRDAVYRNQAERLGIDHRVKFLGFVDDVRPCFAGCDLFAFPTFYDPCSLVVPEALHAGLPVITSGCNGAAELLEEGKTGFTVADPWDAAAWSERMGRLIDDANLRKKMSNAAQSAAKRMTMEVRLAELLPVLMRLAPNQPTVRVPTTVVARPPRRAA